MAGNRTNPGLANGTEVRGNPDSTLATEGRLTRSSEAFAYETAGDVSYQRYAPSGDVVIHHEPARTETSSTSANGRRNG